ncbi:MAG: ABC transporter ATP-binding protein [Proteobacteria bacterium]|nr:ABC transporter ATP-binding protein [Pseudomonadota bacterium]
MKKLLNLSVTAMQGLWTNNVRLARIAWESHKAIVLGMLVASLVIAVIPFMQSGANALLINELVTSIGKGVSHHLMILIGLVIGAAIIPEIIYGVKGYFDRRFWITMEEKFQLLFLERKGAIDVASYENPKFNDLVQKAEERSIYPLLNLLDAQFTNSQNIIGVTVASVILLTFDWRIFLLVLVASIPKFIVEMRYGYGVWGIFDAKAEERRRFSDIRNHFYRLPDLTELKLFQNVKYFHSIIRDLLQSFNAEQKRNERKKFTRQLVSVIISGAAIGFATIWIILEVVKGNIEIGTMMFMIASIAGLQNALSGFLMSVARQHEHSLFVTDLFKVMDTQPVIEQPANPIVLSDSNAPEIVFENVSFAYPNTTTPVLKNVSLTIPSGSKTALVGINGAGKTTLVKLICRFYDPTFGRILVNGRDLREVDLDSWHSQLGVLFQDYATYHFQVKDVISMGRKHNKPDTHLEDVKQAAQMSDASTFIEDWVAGYEQMIGKEFTGGIDPSKGQLQKLALARLFYRDPRFMILDEPTASIDAEAEAKIFERIESMNGDRTVILISHRFSTVRNADQICILKDGTISELGTHEELMKQEQTYARLFELQAKGYRD